MNTTPPALLATVLGRTRLLLLVLFGVAAVPSPGLAQSRVRDLSHASIEDLMNIEITSASRKEQRAAVRLTPIRTY